MKEILVTRSSLPPWEEYLSEIQDIWDTHWLTNMGEKHEKLRKELISYLEVSNIELFTNGHMALELALQAMDLHGEVITTPFTFASTTHAIVRNGLKPVFCDINPLDFTIDVGKIEDLITEKTCAIMPVHVYGNVCDVEEIDRIAQKYNLKVVYDAAHAFGIKYKGMGIGTFGDASCFSFHATKVFNTIEGGAVCYHDDSLGINLYRLKNFGIRGPETVDGIGANAKMNEFCAAMGLCNLRHISEEISKREKIVKRYTENLVNIEGLYMGVKQENVTPNYAYFPIIIEEQKFGVSRNYIYEVLEKYGIKVRKYFYPITSAFECYKERYNKRQTPIALSISESVLTLPLYADLGLADVDMICDIIKRKK
ncbi:MAG: DegT/DnrJ/EryC1/StrS family aminotransferase [Lachnospiraceae bacterium]|jgi:dTDP-4-amino-4,6-dideoxygalactose transaminase|nr:DegT/DnrJ/EryC1/StrS family aminotransferase [Lachnospiraceae bacterium]MCI9328190.1 DegT/DnrJ/EryC1/StrS family aminotransferase [Lachnospiraceae bacterium]